MGLTDGRSVQYFFYFLLDLYVIEESVEIKRMADHECSLYLYVVPCNPCFI